MLYTKTPVSMSRMTCAPKLTGWLTASRATQARRPIASIAIAPKRTLRPSTAVDQEPALDDGVASEQPIYVPGWKCAIYEIVHRFPRREALTAGLEVCWNAGDMMAIRSTTPV
jgi:hypothetical protein